jgi:uncharacterized protein YceH (UPF0502 family)
VHPILDDVEVRVLGALIEKEITTPDYYPLSLNALTVACNQMSNRTPVTYFEAAAVERAADSLREKGLVHLVDRGDSRVTKYRHVVYEAMNLGRPAIAVLDVLMLRGPQTLGEIRTRSSRLYDFSSLEEAEMTLKKLLSDESPLIARLSRQPGQKEVRYAHLMSGDVPAAAASDGEIEAPAVYESDRIERLEKQVTDLQSQFDDLRRQFEVFRKQFE